MTPIEEYFQHIVVISLVRRPDRREHVTQEMSALGITNWQFFDAIDFGLHLGNHSCSASHKAVMKMIVENNWDRCLVLEDDFARRFDDAQERFASYVAHIPSAWDMLYLAGHYGTPPQGWASKYWVRMGQMKTTSTYAVTRKSAAELYEVVPEGTSDSIDNLYGGYNESKECFICEPRLFVQYENYSDLQRRVMANEHCMQDTSHVTRLGKFLPK